MRLTCSHWPIDREYGSVEQFLIRRTRLLSRRIGSDGCLSLRASCLSGSHVQCSPSDRSSQMSKQMTPLRQRMIEDMTIRNMAVNSQKNYVRAVANFSIFHGCSPDKLSFEDVRDYRLHLISRGLKPNTINPIMGALRFFYGTTLGRKEVSEQIPYARREDTLP